VRTVLGVVPRKQLSFVAGFGPWLIKVEDHADDRLVQWHLLSPFSVGLRIIMGTGNVGASLRLGWMKYSMDLFLGLVDISIEAEPFESSFEKSIPIP